MCAGELSNGVYNGGGSEAEADVVVFRAGIGIVSTHWSYSYRGWGVCGRSPDWTIYFYIWKKSSPIMSMIYH